jgi:hypothetical protein
MKTNAMHGITTRILLLALAALLCALPAVAQTATSVTGAGAGAFPSGVTFNGVSLSTLRFGIGVNVPGDGTASGDFQTTLLGTSLGVARQITVTGKVNAGSILAGGARFSGTCSIDMGDGSAPLTGVPFTVTTATASDGSKTLALVLGVTSLAPAAVKTGNIVVQ